MRARWLAAQAAQAACLRSNPKRSLLRTPAADPWEHVIATGLGGMVGSYVVAWEVRSPIAQSPRLLWRAMRSAYERARSPVALQERVTKEVADLEAKRAKRFAGACARRSARPSGD